MRAYLALLRVRARTLFQYRTAALAGVGTQVVFGLILCGVLMAFYDGTEAGQPMTLQQAITYTWVGQAMLGMLPWNIDSETGASVRTGAVAYDLAKPLDMYAHWYARALALRTAPTLLKSIPIFLMATFLLPSSLQMQWPSIAHVAAWMLTTVGALFLSCALTLAMQSTLFWTVAGDGITRIVPHFASLLSGMVIPLPLMPVGLQPFLRLQPFGYVSSEAVLYLCGISDPRGVLGTFAMQLLWTLVFVLLGRLVLRRGLRKLTVAGG